MKFACSTWNMTPNEDGSELFHVEQAGGAASQLRSRIEPNLPRNHASFPPRVFPDCVADQQTQKIENFNLVSGLQTMAFRPLKSFPQLRPVLHRAISSRRHGCSFTLICHGKDTGCCQPKRRSWQNHNGHKSGSVPGARRSQGVACGLRPAG